MADDHGEVHAIAALTSPTHMRIVPQTTLDKAVEVLAERAADEQALREQVREEKLGRERAEHEANQAREDLNAALGQLRTANQLIRQYRHQLGIRD